VHRSGRFSRRTKRDEALALIFTVVTAVAMGSTVLVVQFQVNVDEGVITVSDVNEGKVLGRTTFERWGVVAPTQDKLRHVALDVTAAVIAGHGQRERSVTPSARVYSFAEREKAPHITATFEQGAIFVLLSDTQRNGRYEALIHMARVGQVSLRPVVNR
jgi:hypothetical protein